MKQASLLIAVIIVAFASTSFVRADRHDADASKDSLPWVYKSDQQIPAEHVQKTPEPDGGVWGDIKSLFQLKLTGPAIDESRDKDAVTYKVKVKGRDQETVKIRVDGSQIHISGMSEIKSAHLQTTSSFHRIFPVPEGTDPEKVEMKKESDALVIRIPFKKKSG